MLLGKAENMKHLFGIALAAVAVALAGCETESSSEIAVSISPNNVTMTKGESRTFTASGWRDYTWSLSDTSIGILSTTKGDSTVYTAISEAPSNSALPQILTVTVNIASTTTGTTNSPTLAGESLISAEALISVPGVTAPPSDAITISPSTASIKKGQSVELKAVEPSDVTDYVWKLKAPQHGTLSALTGASTIFTATNGPATTLDAPFTQVVSLSSDGGKNTTTAAITISSFP